MSKKLKPKRTFKKLNKDTIINVILITIVMVVFISLLSIFITKSCKKSTPNTPKFSDNESHYKPDFSYDSYMG